jgi:uncharacterized protein DUF6702
VRFNSFNEQGIKINQTFVTGKIIPSMARLFNKWFLVLGLLFIVGWTPLRDTVSSHPLYISVVEVNHNAKDKTLEISCKIFTNDFETTLEKNYKSKVDLINPKDKAATDKWVSDYVFKHLSLKADGKPVYMSYLGFERQEEAVYSYFEVDSIPSVRKIDVTNSILHDFSNDQINIIHCTVGGKRESTKLDYPATTASFSY